MTARVAVVAALALFACGEPEPPATPVETTPPPEPTFQGRSLGEVPEDGEARLAGYEFHEYGLGDLAPGDGVHVVLEQRSVDVAAHVVGEDGDVVLRVDGPTGAYGFEHVCFVARAGGAYRLLVGPLSAEDAGPYGIRVRERASASSSERIRVCEEALWTFSEAEGRRAEASPEVAALYGHAAELWRRRGEPFPLAIALKQTGSYAATRGEIDTALDLYEEALVLLRDLGEEGDPRQVASVLNLTGLACNLAGEPERARASFEEARAISERMDDRVVLAAAISNLALWEASTGDLYRAVDLYREALDVWRGLGRPDEEAKALNGLGFALTRLGLYEQALDVLRDALEIQQQGERPDVRAHTLAAIGWAEHLSGRGEDAIGRFLRAAELYRETGARLDEAGALDRLGSAYRDLGRTDDARRAYEASLAVYRASADRVHTAHTASNLGCLLSDASLLEEAGESFAGFGDRAALAHVRFCQARVERDAGRLDDALRRIKEAMALVDVLRGAALRQGHHAPALRLWQEYSELHVDVLMRLDEREPDAGYDARAFEVSDLARARQLYEMLLEARVDVRSGVPEELLERERSVQRRLNTAELRRPTLLQKDDAAAEIEALERELRGLLRELADVQAAIRSASPRFAELRQPSPVRLAEVQGLLSSDTLLLSYVLGAERSFLFAVSRDGIESHELPPRRAVDDLAWRVYEGLRNSHQRRARRQWPVFAQQLADMLLGSVRGRLAGHRLLVVGDGMLHYVPFAALPADGGDLFVDRHEVVHLPSAAVMKALRQRAAERRPAAKELAVVADAVYSAEDDRLPSPVRAGPSPEGLELLPDLPYTEREAGSILGLVAPEERLAALGFAASPDLVRGGGLAGYRILHFAIHGLLHEDHPALSGVALSMFDETGHRRDGHLRLHEIYALDLPADLVVLSACRTALTREAEGAGLVGLTHGFFYAGASRLVVSLWDVHDEATAELMTAFYRGLFMEGLTPPAALREAQRWMRRQERWQAPYYWAGFVLEGDWG